ncbi:MAG: LD-carboxypeptidase [Rickettsiales bacterium]|nr:LD-carboxypeptidase [Rickettsiales bacterium]
MTIKFKPLHPKSTACIVAPAYGVSFQSQVARTIGKAFSIVSLYGLKPTIYEDVIVPTAHSLFNDSNLKFANTDAQRAEQFNQALNDTACDAIWFFRGGYGSIRIIKYLEEPQTAKPIIGFSDITAIHVYSYSQWNMPTIHFGMPGALQSYMYNPINIESLQKVLFASKGDIMQFQLHPLINEANYSSITGITCGGNKYVFEKMLLTKFTFTLENKILILEDVGETPRWVDGFLQALTLRDDFSDISAIIFGTFSSQGHDNMIQKTLEEFATESIVPVFQLDPQNTIGHGEINTAIVLGISANITSTSGEIYLSIRAEDYIDYSFLHDEL